MFVNKLSFVLANSRMWIHRRPEKALSVPSGVRRQVESHKISDSNAEERQQLNREEIICFSDAERENRIWIKNSIPHFYEPIILFNYQSRFNARVRTSEGIISSWLFNGSESSRQINLSNDSGKASIANALAEIRKVYLQFSYELTTIISSSPPPPLQWLHGEYQSSFDQGQSEMRFPSENSKCFMMLI